MTKLTKKQKTEIKERYEKGELRSHLAKEFKVSLDGLKYMIDKNYRKKRKEQITKQQRKRFAKMSPEERREYWRRMNKKDKGYWKRRYQTNKDFREKVKASSRKYQKKKYKKKKRKKGVKKKMKKIPILQKPNGKIVVLEKTKENIPVKIRKDKQKKNKFQTAIEMLVEEQDKSIRLEDELKRTKGELDLLKNKTQEFLMDFNKTVSVLGKLGEKLKGGKRNE